MVELEIEKHPIDFGNEQDIFLDSESKYFKTFRNHRKKHPFCVPNIDILTTSSKTIAIQKLRVCKGIFLLFPDNLKGGIHLWPEPENVQNLQKNIKMKHPGLSFRNATPVLFSSFDSYLNYENGQYKDLGLTALYNDLSGVFPELIFDQSHYFSHPLIQYCTLELTNEGLKIFDYTRIIDRNKNEWYLHAPSWKDNAILRSLHLGLMEVNIGLSYLNRKLRTKEVIK